MSRGFKFVWLKFEVWIYNKITVMAFKNLLWSLLTILTKRDTKHTSIHVHVYEVYSDKELHSPVTFNIMKIMLRWALWPMGLSCELYFVFIAIHTESHRTLFFQSGPIGRAIFTLSWLMPENLVSLLTKRSSNW